jgi:hypothetical protein
MPDGPGDAAAGPFASERLAGRQGFDAFAAALVGLPLTHIWRGHGSAIVLEFGRLAIGGRRRGSPKHPSGEMSLMIEWSWRLEGRRSILCGSWSDGRQRERAFALLCGGAVASASLFGRLPEIEVTFTNGVRLVSFMTAGGDPMWTLFDRSDAQARWIGVRRGALEVGTD